MPEMFATGYVPEQAFSLAENFDADNEITAKTLQEMAERTGCFVLGGGMHRLSSVSFTNRTRLYTPSADAEKMHYDKLHPFFPEQKQFVPGKNVEIFNIRNFKIAPFICYDLRFPEEFRKGLAKGAQAFTVQASWPATRNEHWETLLKARAIENQAYVIAVNNVSSDSSYIGNSQVVAPDGTCIAKAQTGKEQVIHAEISIDIVKRCREDFPVL